MKSITSWKRNMPNTVVGESITITHIVSSFNVKEIDELQKTYEQIYGSFIVSEKEQNE